MDAITEVIPADWAALIGSIAFVMVLLKAGLKTYLPPLVAKVRILETDEAEIKASFMVLAGIVGVVLAFTVYSDVSYLKEFDRVIDNKWLEYADHITVGVLCSLGEKAVADSWDKVKQVLDTVLPAGAPDA